MLRTWWSLYLLLACLMAFPVRADEAGKLQDPLAAAEALSRAFQHAVQRTLPAVVTIRAKRQARVGETHLAFSEVGSGVVVRLSSDLDPVVLTSAHVVRGIELERLDLVLMDGTVLHPKRILVDDSSDVGVVQIRERDVYTAELGDSDQVQVGQWVLAIGSPFGLRGTVTHGIISARGRRSLALGSGDRPVINQDFFQTDAPIHPGSSGGPLVDLRGRVIGIAAAIASTTDHGQGIGFAVPSNLARRIALELIRYERVRRAYLGVKLEPSLDARVAAKLGLRRVRGALVGDVLLGTPADQAGLKPFDVILEVNGRPVEDEEHLRHTISLSPVGEPVRLKVWRNRKTLELTVQLADRDQFAGSDASHLSRVPLSRELLRLGVRAITLDENLREKLQVPHRRGVVVLGLNPHFPAAAQLELLDVIIAIDGTPVRDVREADAVLARADEDIELTILRSGLEGSDQRTVTIER